MSKRLVNFFFSKKQALPFQERRKLCVQRKMAEIQCGKANDVVKIMTSGTCQIEKCKKK